MGASIGGKAYSDRGMPVNERHLIISIPQKTHIELRLRLRILNPAISVVKPAEALDIYVNEARQTR